MWVLVFFLFLFQLFSRTQASNEILNIPLASTSSHSRKIKGIVLPLLILLFSIFFLSTPRCVVKGTWSSSFLSPEVGCCWVNFTCLFPVWRQFASCLKMPITAWTVVSFNLQVSRTQCTYYSRQIYLWKFYNFFSPLGITFSETRKNMLANLATTSKQCLCVYKWLPFVYEIDT